MKKISTLLFSAAFVMATQYGFTQCENGEHTTEVTDSWLSCTAGANPNPLRGNSHWIMYDLSTNYELNESHIWNYNVAGSTGRGIRNCYIDFSSDGMNWTEWGSVEIPQAPGSDLYTGLEGPDFDGAVTRFVLITVIDTWNNDGCAGLAELRIDGNATSVSVEEQALLWMEMWPNPANDVLNLRNLSHGFSNVEIWNSAGELVLSTTMNLGVKTISLGNLAEGLYIVKASTPGAQAFVRRFVIAR